MLSGGAGRLASWSPRRPRRRPASPASSPVVGDVSSESVASSVVPELEPELDPEPPDEPEPPELDALFWPDDPPLEPGGVSSTRGPCPAVAHALNTHATDTVPVTTSTHARSPMLAAKLRGTVGVKSGGISSALREARDDTEKRRAIAP